MDIKSKITEGIIIAGVPVISYWFAFIYQFGYCKYFEVPAEFIEVNIQSFFICIIGVASIFGFIVVYGSPIFSIFKIVPDVIGRKFRSLGISFFLMATYSFVSKIPTKSFIIMALSLYSFLLFIEFILPLFSHKEKNSYIEKLEAAENLDHKHESIMDAFAKKIGFSVYIALFYASLVSMFILFLGAYEAKSTSKFMVVNNGSKVVIKKYGEQFLLAHFNKAEKCISPSFSIEKIDSGLGEFSYELVGHIVVKEECN
jgi:hypothetical protein